ncbi:MAG: hypothetical protein K5839_00300 [Treponemataceae bacterium]|nr:hypothetical protein [Treponemataceae bacterium]
MKKSISLILLCLLFTGLCFAKVNADTAIVNSDWKDKALGEQEKPAWVMTLLRGTESVFRREWGIKKDRVIRTGRGTALTQNAAKTKSQLNVAASIANELKMNLVNNLERSESVSAEELELVNRIASGTTVTVSGLREEADFWWKTLERNPKNRKLINRYVYVTVYTMPKDVWDKTVQNYLLSIMKTVGIESVQKALGAQFSNLTGLSNSDQDRTLVKAQYENATRDMTSEKTNEEKDLDEADNLLMSMFQ